MSDIPAYTATAMWTWRQYRVSLGSAHQELLRALWATVTFLGIVAAGAVVLAPSMSHSRPNGSVDTASIQAEDALAGWRY